VQALPPIGGIDDFRGSTMAPRWTWSANLFPYPRDSQREAAEESAGNEILQIVFLHGNVFEKKSEEF
jgi:hypothetical protein